MDPLLKLEDCTPDSLAAAMEKAGYICDPVAALTIYLALRLERPLLVEGAAGVGKTEIGKVLSRVFGLELIRLQCYEGLDESRALYEWNYQRQLLRIQMEQARRQPGSPDPALPEEDLFSPAYLLERPLLRAIRAQQRPVLLIDEIDKTDAEFEAFLFELLSDFQVSIPELGTLRARQIPIVVLTSNGERELSDGLRRRCLYLYLDYPDVDKERRIILAQVPGISPALAGQIARAVHKIRTELDLEKKPAIAETLDWARALALLCADTALPEMNAVHAEATLNILLKNKADQDSLRNQLRGQGLLEWVQGA